MLLSFYEKFDVKGYSLDWSLERQGEYNFDLSYIEVLLTNKQVLSTLTNEQKILLLKETITKINDKYEENEVYSILSIERTVYLAYRTLESREVLNTCDIHDNADIFIEYGTFAQYDPSISIQAIIDSIMMCASEQVN